MLIESKGVFKMKTGNTPQDVINALLKKSVVFGDDSVDHALNTVLAWYHTFKNEQWQITIADRYIFISSAFSSHPLLNADLVFDLQESTVVVDSRGLILGMPLTISDVQLISEAGTTSAKNAKSAPKASTAFRQGMH
jgi:hypothetical protein